MQSRQSLKELHWRYLEVMAEMSTRLASAIQRLPETKRRGFELETWDFDAFRENWKLISRNPGLHAAWLARLAPGGLDAERAAILDVLRGNDPNVSEAGSFPADSAA